MNIAIASGKGGTGKTTVAVNLASVVSSSGTTVEYLDCDVEEPNGHLFLRPEISSTTPSVVPVPVIDEALCTACGECVQMCRFNALVRLGEAVMVFPGLCHGCGGCVLVCPRKAIAETTRTIGTIREGVVGSLRFVDGHLEVGEAMSPPVVRDVVSRSDPKRTSIIDAPPGTSCPVVTSISRADFILLVTDPTPFGLNDLGLALDLVSTLNIAHGVVVNRSTGSDRVHRFCEGRNVEILAEIPASRDIAHLYSRGQLLCDADGGYANIFTGLWNAIQRITKVGG